MGTNDGGSRGISSLVLDYIRVIIWPTILIFGLFYYKSDISKILQERELEIAGLKIGQKVSEIKENVQVELADIQKLLKELQASTGDSAKAAAITKKIVARTESLNKGLNKDIAQIRIGTQKAAPDITNTRAMAKDWELKGFDFILAKDVERAIKAFANAEAAWPEYHNVAEIKKLLTREEGRLAKAAKDGDNNPWRELYQTLLAKYSWGMPLEVRNKLQE